MSRGERNGAGEMLRSRGEAPLDAPLARGLRGLDALLTPRLPASGGSVEASTDFWKSRKRTCGSSTPWIHGKDSDSARRRLNNVC